MAQESPKSGLFSLGSLKIQNIIEKKNTNNNFKKMHLKKVHLKKWVLVEKFFQLDFAD